MNPFTRAELMIESLLEGPSSQSYCGKIKFSHAEIYSNHRNLLLMHEICVFLTWKYIYSFHS